MTTTTTVTYTRPLNNTTTISHSDSINIHRLHAWVFLTETAKTNNTETVHGDNVTITIVQRGSYKSGVIRVTSAGHGLTVGHSVILGLTNYTGTSLDGTYTVTTVVNTSIFEIDASTLVVNTGSYTGSLIYQRTVTYSSLDIGKRCRVIGDTVSTFYDLVGLEAGTGNPIWQTNSSFDLLALDTGITITDASIIPIGDNNSSSVLKKFTWTTIKANLRTYFNTLYQSILVSGTSIKTINTTTLLGAGNINVQEPLVSGTSIKTINGISILGSGDMAISGGSGVTSAPIIVFNTSVVGNIPTLVGSIRLPPALYNAPSAEIGTGNPLYTAKLDIREKDGTLISTISGQGGLDWYSAVAGFTINTTSDFDLLLYCNNVNEPVFIKSLSF